MELNKRNIQTYKFLYRAAAPFAKILLNYHWQPAENTGRAALVLANHTTDYDPIFVGVAMPKPMAFVASEHTFRWGFASRLLQYFFGLIPRVKGTTGVSTTKDILRTLRSGQNVCIFPEGNRTFSGTTLPFVAATGKLAKSGGADLITFRIEGGYLAWPRWGHTRRKGPITGRVVGHYAAEELAGMSADAINEHIAQDLYEDAYARQRAQPVRYAGKALAEWLEITLYLCPACRRFGTLISRGDSFACNCGLAGRYDEYGMLRGEGLPFDAVDAWDAWQQEQLAVLAAKAQEGQLFEDEAQSLYAIDPCVGVELLETATLSMGCGELRLGTRAFPLESITDMAVTGRMTLTFSSASGAQFEVRSGHPRSALKYMHLYQTCKNRRKAHGNTCAGGESH